MSAMRERAASPEYDAIVVGSGPNGLAASVRLARSGYSVLVCERNPTVGGGCTTTELTLPGFRHDVCSAVHPLGAGSPFFRELPLAEHGLHWLHSEAPLAHPLADGRPIFLERDVDGTARQFDRDAAAWRGLMGPLVEAWDNLGPQILGPLRIPRNPVTLARFGLRALRSAKGLAESWFDGQGARSLFAGMAGHALLPLDRSPSAAFGLVLGLAGHVIGWPIPRGGAQRLTDALASLLLAHGGEILTDAEVLSLDELPRSRVVLLDLTPRRVLAVAGERLPTGYRRRLERYRYGPGVFKVDYALDGPIPWRNPECTRAVTVHLGGTAEEIYAGEEAVGRGEVPRRPLVLLTQPTLVDPSRAPAGKHVAWTYCHVPAGCPVDMTGSIEDQLERYAPGFRDRVLARSRMGPAAYEAHNPNMVGGDITGGTQDLGQLLTRPVARLNPYSTPFSGLFLCSSATPPGGAVHGMCGYFAALAAERALARGVAIGR